MFFKNSKINQELEQARKQLAIKSNQRDELDRRYQKIKADNEKLNQTIVFQKEKIEQYKKSIENLTNSNRRLKQNKSL
jgi:chromosome condensin MukBEF ATPase and DNA-binding subunit MukB